MTPRKRSHDLRLAWTWRAWAAEGQDRALPRLHAPTLACAYPRMPHPRVSEHRRELVELLTIRETDAVMHYEPHLWGVAPFEAATARPYVKSQDEAPITLASPRRRR